MLDVKSKPVLLELSLDILSRRAVFTVYRSLYYYPRRSLVCGFGDFQVNVAIARVHASIFKKRVRYVDQLKFTTAARSGSAAESYVQLFVAGDARAQGSSAARHPAHGG